MENGRTRYPDIIDHPRHVSATRQRMSDLERAAQFSPFAALRGYGELIREASAPPGEKTGPDENTRSEWNYLLQFLFQTDAEAAFTCGSRTFTGRIVRYDGLNRRITLDSGARVNIDELTALDSSAIDRFIGQEMCDNGAAGEPESGEWEGER